MIDDRWGRDLSERFDLDCHGTLWVLGQLHNMQLVSASKVRESVQTMRDRGIRLPRNAVNNMLIGIGELPLSE